MSYLLKDSAADLDYGFDWSATLGAGLVPTASSWRTDPAEPGGLAVVSASASGTATSALVTGGIAGRVYRLINRIGFDGGRTDERQITIRVEDR